MTSESWFAIDSDDSPLRNRKITTVVLILIPYSAFMCLGEVLGEREVVRLFFISQTPDPSFHERLA